MLTFVENMLVEKLSSIRVISILNESFFFPFVLVIQRGCSFLELVSVTGKIGVPQPPRICYQYMSAAAILAPSLRQARWAGQEGYDVYGWRKMFW